MDRVFHSFVSKWVTTWKQDYPYLSPAVAIVPLIAQLDGAEALLDLTAVVAQLNGTSVLHRHFAKLRLRLIGPNQDRILFEIDDSRFFDRRPTHSWREVYTSDPITARLVDFNPNDQLLSQFYFATVKLYAHLKKFGEAVLQPFGIDYYELNRQLRAPYEAPVIAVLLDHTLALHPDSPRLSQRFTATQYAAAEPDHLLIAELNAAKKLHQRQLVVDAQRPIEFLHETLAWLARCGLEYDRVTFNSLPAAQRIDMPLYSAVVAHTEALDHV